MTALWFQTGGRHQTSPTSLWVMTLQTITLTVILVTKKFSITNGEKLDVWMKNFWSRPSTWTDKNLSKKKKKKRKEKKKVEPLEDIKQDDRWTLSINKTICKQSIFSVWDSWTNSKPKIWSHIWHDTCHADASAKRPAFVELPCVWFSQSPHAMLLSCATAICTKWKGQDWSYFLWRVALLQPITAQTAVSTG